MGLFNWKDKRKKEKEKPGKKEMKEAVLTLYACRKDGDAVPEIA